MCHRAEGEPETGHGGDEDVVESDWLVSFRRAQSKSDEEASDREKDLKVNN